MHLRDQPVDVSHPQLKLNADKTELMWAGTKDTVACLLHDRNLTIGTDTVAVTDAVRVLGGLFTPDLARRSYVYRLPTSWGAAICALPLEDY